MRMWMVDPKQMCNKHLVGEHGEIHKHRHNFVKEHNMTGRVFPVTQIEPLAMKGRHDQLAEEMIRRGMNHNSPYEQPNIFYLPVGVWSAQVNVSLSRRELRKRCPECARLLRKKVELCTT